MALHGHGHGLLGHVNSTHPPVLHAEWRMGFGQWPIKYLQLREATQSTVICVALNLGLEYTLQVGLVASGGQPNSWWPAGCAHNIDETHLRGCDLTTIRDCDGKLVLYRGVRVVAGCHGVTVKTSERVFDVIQQPHAARMCFELT